MKAYTKKGTEVDLRGLRFRVHGSEIEGEYIPMWTREKKTGVEGVATRVLHQGQHVFLALEKTPEIEAYIEKQARIESETVAEKAETEKHAVKLNLGVCFRADYTCHYVTFDDRKSEEEIIAHILTAGKEELSCCHKPVSHEDSIMSAFRDWKTAENIKLERKVAKAEKIQAATSKAKATGKDVLISTYSTECKSRTEECNIDIVYVYITPQGEKKYVQHHTY